MLFAAVAAFGLYVGPTHAATTHVVDDDTITGNCSFGEPTHSTIQAAVSVSASGDTVRVCPGIYNENVTVSTADLTIEGAKVGQDGRSRSVSGSGESEVRGTDVTASVKLEPNNITWDGFLVSNNASGAGLHTSALFSGYEIATPCSATTSST